MGTKTFIELMHILLYILESSGGFLVCHAREWFSSFRFLCEVTRLLTRFLNFVVFALNPVCQHHFDTQCISLSI